MARGGACIRIELGEFRSRVARAIDRQPAQLGLRPTGSKENDSTQQNRQPDDCGRVPGVHPFGHTASGIVCIEDADREVNRAGEELTHVPP